MTRMPPTGIEAACKSAFFETLCTHRCTHATRRTGTNEQRAPRLRSREQRRVIELAAVDKHVCVGVACHLQGALSDEGADLRPRPPLTMEEADPPMAEVVR